MRDLTRKVNTCLPDPIASRPLNYIVVGLDSCDRVYEEGVSNGSSETYPRWQFMSTTIIHYSCLIDLVQAIVLYSILIQVLIGQQKY